MSFTDNLLALFKKPEVQSGLSLAATGATLPTPTFSAVLSAVKEGVNLIDQIRLNYIIQGLASGLNQETMLNELTNYVSASEDNAYHVANTLRKALFTESRKGCILLGRILADHIGKNERYDRDDIIIAHAIESATDEDLVNFREMMKKYSGGDIEIIDQTTVDWCYSNRLFVMRIVEYQKFETEARKLNKASFDVACRVLEALEMNIADYFHGKYAVGEEVFFDQDGKERYVATGRLTSEDVTGD